MQKCSVDKNTDALILHPQTIDKKHQTTPNEYNVGTCILIKSNNVPAPSYIFSLRVKNGRNKLGLVCVDDIKDNDFIFALSGSLLKMKGNRS